MGVSLGTGVTTALGVIEGGEADRTLRGELRAAPFAERVNELSDEASVAYAFRLERKCRHRCTPRAGRLPLMARDRRPVGPFSSFSRPGSSPEDRDGG